MADPKGFLKVQRQYPQYRAICERIKDYREVMVLRKDRVSQEQASRCMDCGTPFCHWGCPVGNYIPEWNDLMFQGQWKRAFELLYATNNFPEITGRVCPAYCEYSCILGINDDPVTIRENELAIIEHAFKTGEVKPAKPQQKTGKRIAIVGSGPSGLACADQLNRAGHKVVVFERDDKIGGILRYGIPDFKLEKSILDRRLKVLEKAGIEFITSTDIGIDYPVAKLEKEFAAICLAGGSRVPWDLNIEGRGLKGIHFAMEFLTQANRRVAGERISQGDTIEAKSKKVVVIGGGDTGADCVGVALRQGASCVVQVELLPQPPSCRTENTPWPKYPLILKTSSSHEEGGERHWSVLTKKFIGEKGRVRRLSCIKVEFGQKDKYGCPIMREIPGSGFEIEADLVILAMGFVRPEKKGLIENLELKLDQRGNVKTNDNFLTSRKKIFCCGDMRRGQSVIVWAISEGRRAASAIDTYLMGYSNLPIL